MIFQTDIELNKSVFQFDAGGCALFCVVHKAVEEGTYTFEREQFVKDCMHLRFIKVLSTDCTILNWDRLLKYFYLPFELVFNDGTHKINPDWELEEDEFQLLYLYNPQTGYHHFVEGDHNDNIRYDSLPYSVTSDAYRMGIGHIESKRVFRRKE